ncbi:PDDEXK nuclease domain-containing protein [Niabella sp. CC-SYL272]|uniref:PDDEXK nuclease domain-containing protein n=1 Tax=Niabella agricola TaxID=2891571 RepID=UPI001F24E3C9|nr:PDDEXK nuclease domain-containing protein [Niabella agricola]MCF3112074.1 PDDEXK nuclease domain-containing protein [Niabella agricola]
MKPEKTYLQFVQTVKKQILQSRYQAAKLVNNELLLLYYNIGHSLHEKMTAASWGDKVLQQIAVDLQKELPGLRGFSYRSLKNMRQFYDCYQMPIIGQSVTAQLPNHSTGKRRSAFSKKKIGQSLTAQLDSSFINTVFTALSFTHHILLINKCKEMEERIYYMHQAASNHWTVHLLQHHIESNLYHKKGKLPNNFRKALPKTIAAHALNTFKDEYLLDFINITPDDDERVFENKIINNIRQFILSLGTGFSFMGTQYRLVVDEEEFFTDLLFFNRVLQCLVAIELKRGRFKPEYAGKLNFYLNLLDDQVKLPHEHNSIGIILCKEKNNKVVEYAFKSMHKAMGVATYKTSKQLPSRLKKILPDAAALKKLL